MPSAPVKDVKSKFKRLIICCDGTWVAADQAKTSKEAPSNVTRFSRALEKAEFLPDGTEIQQVIFYQKGVGTGDMSTLDSVLAGGTGFGLDANVREAYYFLSNNYQEGDEIYLFGFSRGAYTARAISGLLGDVGLLDKYGIPNFPDIYAQYRQRDDNPGSQGVWNQYVIDHNLKKYRMPGVRVVIVGVWDTVGSLGVPENKLSKALHWNKKLQFYNTELSGGVENAFHCLALDERRSNFVPTLWYLPPAESEDVDVPKVVSVPGPKDPAIVDDIVPKKNAPRVNLQQCWFMGVHSDVGGGDAYNECSDITLSWMIERCEPFLDFDEEYVRFATKKPDVPIPAVPTPHPPQGSSIIDPEYAAGPIGDSFTGIYLLAGSTYRAPGQYTFVEADGPDKGKSLRQNTMESIHPSVRLRRMKRPDWQPPALNGFQAEPSSDPFNPGGWTWSKTLADNTVITLPEWKMQETSASFGPGRVSDLYEISLLKPADAAALADASKPLPPVNVAVILGSAKLGNAVSAVKHFF